MNNGIHGFADIMLTKIKDMVDSNTVIGDTITAPDGTMIIPVSKVQVGFGSGGADLKGAPTESDKRISGGGGGGLLVTPVAFVVIAPNGGVKLMQIADKNQTVDRALNLLPEIVEQIKKLFTKDKDKKTEAKAPEAEPAESAEKGKKGLSYEDYSKLSTEEIIEEVEEL
ncbi:MAG: sporulation protein YtfJ [Oscillospiraceae bacterium]|jgi:sporulation protein YtfJ|nr:sporulation protein YtfJ [Oscillospiraceae bacterium]